MKEQRGECVPSLLFHLFALTNVLALRTTATQYLIAHITAVPQHQKGGTMKRHPYVATTYWCCAPLVLS